MAHLDDCNFVVTGATGWLGRASLGALEARLGDAFAARVFAYATKDGQTSLQSGRIVRYGALNAISELPPARYAVLHCAFLGKERVADMPLGDYVQLNAAISEQVCDAARRIKAQALFVPSSGAVYAKDRMLETDIGKNPYGVMKLKDEARFTRLAEELQCPLLVARVFNVAGPYMNKTTSYALGSILEDVAHHRPVRIRAAQRIIRSYSHVMDLMELVLAMLDEGAANPVWFDTAGEREIEVGELARLVLDLLGHKAGAIERPALDSTLPDNRYVGDGTAMRMLAARHDITLRPLSAQIADTASFLAG